MNIRTLLLAGGLGSVFGGVFAVVLLPFAVVQRLHGSKGSGGFWVPVVAASLLVVFSNNDPVLISGCGLLLAADLARQQPIVPPESLVAFSLLMGAYFDPSDMASLEAVPLVLLLAGIASLRCSFATPGCTIGGGVLMGLSWGLLIAEVWVHFFTLG